MVTIRLMCRREAYDIIAQNGNASDSVYNIVITTGTRQFEFTFDKITAQ